MKILKEDGYKIIHLSDGNLIKEAVKMINAGQADGINFNFIWNYLHTIDEIRAAPATRYIRIMDNGPDFELDYSAIYALSKLESLSIYTSDRQEINYLNFPILHSTALFWLRKAKSLYQCRGLERLFLGKYSEPDLTKLEFLTKLTYLRINTGSVKRLTGIEKLQDLSTIYLMQATRLEDLTGIEQLPNLRYLMIDNCRNIKNIQLLTEVRKMVDVQIVGTTPTLK
jgi:hypothetical protein